MLPAAIVPLRSIPLTRNGKLDVAALPEIESSMTAASEQGFSSDLERRPRRPYTPFWKEILGIEEFSVTGRFFDLGGHSLLAIRMIALVEERLSRKLSIRTCSRPKTVRALAQTLTAAARPRGRR